ncbi:glycosyltransferase [Azospirillum soli]|uniref:glycosyltransferase n=1 Tax=Azospirillum soli TaxID=1304799 RepID=UPI001AEB0813|nr:glycosyltransferase [Azospirillum soli]MBP2316243.1 hypothetical protein [Azospirillum soli]
MKPQIGRPDRGPRIAVLMDPERFDDLEALARLQAVAAKAGATVVATSTGEPPPLCRFDAALALSIRGPKPAGIPTYAIVAAGADSFTEPARFRDLLTYDGYLTLSDTVASWLRNVMFGARKLDAPVARFGVTPLLSTEAGPKGTGGLAFVGSPDVGTERDAVLGSLADRPYLRLHGEGWDRIAPSQAARKLAPDGHAVIDAYRAAGAGLCLDPAPLRAEQGITPRLFDITAAGVPCLCAWAPDVEELFGDCLLYIDLDAPAEAIAWQIDDHMDWLARHPDAAAAKARKAHTLFLEQFTLDALFDNLLAFLGEAAQRQKDWQAAADAELISVAILGKAGQESAKRFATTIASVARQQGGRPDIFAVAWGDEADEALSDAPPPDAGVSVTWRSLPDGNRCDALWAALDWLRSRPGHFCILEAGDQLYPEHLSSLLAAMRKIDGRYWYGPVRLAYSGARLEDAVADQQSVHFQFFSPNQFEDPLSCEAAPGFLARTDLIDDEILQNPKLPDGEELYLWLLLAERTFFAFSARITLTAQPRPGVARTASPDSAERFLMRFLGRSTFGATPYSLTARQSDGTAFEAFIDPALKIPAFRLQRGGRAEASANLLSDADLTAWPISVERREGLPLGIFRLSAYFAQHWANISLLVQFTPLDGGAARSIAVPVRQRLFGSGIRLDGNIELRQAEGPVRVTVLTEAQDAPPPLGIGLWKLDRPLTYRLADLASYEAVWLFGAGGGGRIVLRRMAAAGLPKPAGILDSFLTGQLEDIPIHKLDEVQMALTDRTAVVIASQYWVNIHASLKAAGVRNVFSAFPFNRDIIYRLDDAP